MAPASCLRLMQNETWYRSQGWPCHIERLTVGAPGTHGHTPAAADRSVSGTVSVSL